MQASLRCCSHLFSAAFPSHPSSLHPGIPAHAPSFSPIIPRAIPHNSKCRYGERGAVAARPKAQIILDAAKVSAASGGYSEPKQGQRSQSARDFCPRSTMRVPQPDIIEHFGNADAVPQLPERCLSRKAGIVWCCLWLIRYTLELTASQSRGHRAGSGCSWPAWRGTLPPAFQR